jgi:hypothetical protein
MKFYLYAGLLILGFAGGMATCLLQATAQGQHRDYDRYYPPVAAVSESRQRDCPCGQSCLCANCQCLSKSTKANYVPAPGVTALRTASGIVVSVPPDSFPLTIVIGPPSTLVGVQPMAPQPGQLPSGPPPGQPGQLPSTPPPAQPGQLPSGPPGEPTQPIAPPPGGTPEHPIAPTPPGSPSQPIAPPPQPGQLPSGPPTPAPKQGMAPPVRWAPDMGYQRKY